MSPYQTALWAELRPYLYSRQVRDDIAAVLRPVFRYWACPVALSCAIVIGLGALAGFTPNVRDYISLLVPIGVVFAAAQLASTLFRGKSFDTFPAIIGYIIVSSALVTPLSVLAPKGVSRYFANMEIAASAAEVFVLTLPFTAVLAMVAFVISILWACCTWNDSRYGWRYARLEKMFNCYGDRFDNFSERVDDRRDALVAAGKST